MICAAALCPCPPLLARELTGQADVLPELRAACAAAVATLLESAPEAVAVVGPGTMTAVWDPELRLDPSPYAPATAGLADNSNRRLSPELPLALGLGARLLDEAGYRGPRILQAVAESAEPGECAKLGAGLAALGGRTGLLVMGDGTARRSPSAPGHLDERAAPFDDAVERALRDGDLGALAALDPGLARDLMASGRAPWQLLAAALAPADGVPGATGAARKADIRYADAPLGVAYLVAVITR